MDHFATFISPREEGPPEMDAGESQKSQRTIGQKQLPNIGEVLRNNPPH